MERTITYQFCSHNSDNFYAFLDRIKRFLDDYYAVYFKSEGFSFDIDRFDQQMNPNMILGDIIPSFVEQKKHSFYFTNYPNPKVLFEKIEKIVLEGSKSYQFDNCLVIEFIQPITNEPNTYNPQYNVKDPFTVVFQFNSKYYKNLDDFYERIDLYVNQYFENKLDFLNISHEFFILNKIHEITQCDVVNLYEKQNVLDFHFLNFESPVQLLDLIKSTVSSSEKDTPIVVKLIFEVLPF
jgi:hypothetical protein